MSNRTHQKKLKRVQTGDPSEFADVSAGVHAEGRSELCDTPSAIAAYGGRFMNAAEM